MTSNTTTERTLPYGGQLIEDDDIAAVVAILKGGWLTTGPAVEAFEADFRARVGAGHAVVCSSGTAALHLAALALGLGPGDVVIVPSLTFLASANGPHFTGADIVFADVDSDTGLLTPATLQDAIGRSCGRARAVVPVHLNGSCCDMPAISRVARAHGLAIIEDACHALGTRYRNDHAGNELISVGACWHSDLACFSFHPVKTIAMGEGGAVTTSDKALADALRRCRNHGMVRDPAYFTEREQAFAADGRPHPWYYEMPDPGYNYRVTDFQCALGLSQLGKLDRFAARRREIMALYDRAFADWGDVVCPVPRPTQCDPVLHLYVLLIDFARSRVGTRDEAIRALAKRGIVTQVHYLPVHRQPYYARCNGSSRLSGADAYYDRCLSIPFFPGMTDADVKRVVEALRELLL